MVPTFLPLLLPLLRPHYIVLLYLNTSAERRGVVGRGGAGGRGRFDPNGSLNMPAGVFNHTTDQLRASGRPLEASAPIHWICRWPPGSFRLHQKPGSGALWCSLVLSGNPARIWVLGCQKIK